MNEIINIFENSMSLTVTTVIAAIGVGLNVWFKKKATGDPKREELIKSKFEIYKDMYLQIVLIKRSHCLNKSASEIDEIIKNYYKNLIKLRKQYPALIEGDYEELLSYSPGIYAYARTTKDKSERIIVIANTTAKIRGYKIPELKGATLLASTYGNREATLLRSYEVRVYKVKK